MGTVKKRSKFKGGVYLAQTQIAKPNVVSVRGRVYTMEIER
jgi:hypothetical protein